MPPPAPRGLPPAPRIRAPIRAIATGNSTRRPAARAFWLCPARVGCSAAMPPARASGWRCAGVSIGGVPSHGREFANSERLPRHESGRALYCVPMPAASHLDSLNSAQRKAVTYGEPAPEKGWRAGPLLVSASAGTVKNSTIANRVAQLVLQGVQKARVMLLQLKRSE